MKRTLTGFSMVEILAACAIALVLSALITTAVVRSKEAAKDSKCQSNLQQIGQSLLLYAADYDGFVPPYRTRRLGTWDEKTWCPARPAEWKSCLLAYAKANDVFYCPRDAVRGIHCINWDSTYTSYDTWGVQELQRIVEPGIYLMNLEDNLGSKNPYACDGAWPDIVHQRPSKVLTLHGERGHCVYLDASVKWVPANGSSTPN